MEYGFKFVFTLMHQNVSVVYCKQRPLMVRQQSLLQLREKERVREVVITTFHLKKKHLNV